MMLAIIGVILRTIRVYFTYVGPSPGYTGLSKVSSVNHEYVVIPMAPTSLVAIRSLFPRGRLLL